jgi:hypothetical protein
MNGRNEARESTKGGWLQFQARNFGLLVSPGPDNGEPMLSYGR